MAARTEAKRAVAQARRPTPTPRAPRPTLWAIYREFVLPKPSPEAKRSDAAIKAGIKACSGKAPTEVKDAYYPIAARKGTLKPHSEQDKMIAAIGIMKGHVATPTPSSTVSGLAAADPKTPSRCFDRHAVPLRPQPA